MNLLSTACYSSVTAGLDYCGGHFTAIFTENNPVASVDIPIIGDLISQEGTESFRVQLSLQSRTIMSDLPYITYVRLGSILQATVHIQEEIILNFADDDIVEVNEGANLILIIMASTAINRDYNFTLDITRKDDNSPCKLC